MCFLIWIKEHKNKSSNKFLINLLLEPVKLYPILAKPTLKFNLLLSLYHAFIISQYLKENPQYLHHCTDNDFSILARGSSFHLSISEATFNKVLVIVHDIFYAISFDHK